MAHRSISWTIGAPAAILLLAALATPALGQVVAPELLLVVDGSSSMQQAIGIQETADCTGNKKRSRFSAALEMIAGTRAGQTCKLEQAPQHPDAVNPPVQVSGGKQCIPGLTHSLAETHGAASASSEAKPIGEASWANSPLSGPGELRLKATAADTVLPYFSVDLDGIPTNQGDWVDGGLTVYLKTPDTLNATTPWTYLVWAPIGPSGQTGKSFVCANDTNKPNAVSPPVSIAGVAGQQIRYPLTAAAVTAIRKAVDLGQKTFYFTVVAVETWMNGGCGARTGNAGQHFDAVLHGPAAVVAMQPSFDIRTGVLCVGEGPDTHTAVMGLSNLDGIIDVFGPVAKFALLMTDNVLSEAKDASGGFSFGDKLSTYWGDANLGMADPYGVGSPSVPITGPDSLVARAATYLAISDSINKARPTGGTPLGSLLSDVDDYVGPSVYRDPHFASLAVDPINGDPYFDCRQRVVVLFSDGGANLHNGAVDGRQQALAAVANLWLKGVPVYVAAIGHTNLDGANPPPKADLDFLHSLALAGGTKEAWLVEKPADIIDKLKPVISATGTVGEVLTGAQHIIPRSPKEDAAYSFHARSLFDVIDPLNTRGDLEQRVYSCEGKCKDPKTPDRAQVCEVLDFGEQLTSRIAPRVYYTNIAGEPKELAKTYVSADDMGIPSTGLAPKLVEGVNGTCVTEAGTFDLGLASARNEYRDHLLALIRADPTSCRKNAKLGAVSMSQPAILEPAAKMGLREASFLTYLLAKTPSAHPLTAVNLPGSHQRPTMLFAATHEGVLRAFRVDREKVITLPDGAKAGDEMWSWLPAFNLRRIRQLKLVTTARGSYLGGHVVARHIQLQRTPLAPQQNAQMWRAVVAVGAGEGGSGYFALDVTVPQEPRLLWEITPDRHCWGFGSVNSTSGPVCIVTDTFVNMGRSTAKPVLGTVFMEKAGLGAEVAVAVIVSGKPPNDSDLQNIGADGNGKREVYVVAMMTGEVLRKFTLADMDLTGMTAPSTDPAKELGYFLTEPACYSGAPGQMHSRCFIGDSKGMLWRLDLSDLNPLNWKLQWFHDAYSGDDTPAGHVLPIQSALRVPILSPPALANSAGLPAYIQGTKAGRLVVVYGTGSGVDEASTDRHHLVYSVAELFQVAAGQAERAQANRIWYRDLGDHTRFIGPPLIFDSNAYWASYTVSTSGACKVGAAHVWAGRFDQRRSITVVDKVLGGFPHPGKPYDLASAYESIALGLLKPSPVDIQPVPGCVAGCAPGDFTCYANAGSTGGSAPQYEVVTGNAGSDQGKSQAPQAGTQPKVGTRVQKIKAPRSTALITGWDILLD